MYKYSSDTPWMQAFWKEQRKYLIKKGIPAHMVEEVTMKVLLDAEEKTKKKAKDDLVFGKEGQAEFIFEDMLRCK